ncbi:MAG TPA: SMP-30/gluconolactonase/LRE family protein, partial [Micropepsaceae bacterium]|nr:SMP-30/gluconolactonase/LRE family protein [Micropepsaceae bacterium]
EGPLGVPDGSVYFSDTDASLTYHLDANDKLTVERFDTHRSNGIALTREGEMVWAEGDGPRLSKLDKVHGGYMSLTPGFRLFQPNDLIVDAKGGIYFTDPGPRPVVPGLKVYVYYIPPGGKQPIAIDDSVPRPNGITLSPDGRTLYVDNTIGTVVSRYDVQADGTVKNKRDFATLHDIKPGEEGFGDGMGMDRDGRLYVTSLTGIQVFDKAGKYLGTIKVPRQPSNVAFSGPDKKTLYITARKGLYRLKMLSQGPDRPGK